jgi:P-type E1-E2 ATPase
LEKREFIDGLKKGGATVCMVGDGINDALALTSADVGISVVSATDISIQVSDLLLTTDRLGVIAQARTLARFGQKIAKQKLFWAFAYNIVGVALACFGFLSPIFSAFAMSISSLSVLFNAQRLGVWPDSMIVLKKGAK